MPVICILSAQTRRDRMDGKTACCVCWNKVLDPLLTFSQVNSTTHITQQNVECRGERCLYYATCGHLVSGSLILNCCLCFRSPVSQQGVAKCYLCCY